MKRLKFFGLLVTVVLLAFGFAVGCDNGTTEEAARTVDTVYTGTTNGQAVEITFSGPEAGGPYIGDSYVITKGGQEISRGTIGIGNNGVITFYPEGGAQNFQGTLENNLLTVSGNVGGEQLSVTTAIGGVINPGGVGGGGTPPTPIALTKLEFPHNDGTTGDGTLKIVNQQKIKLTVKFVPANAANKNIIWSLGEDDDEYIEISDVELNKQTATATITVKALKPTPGGTTPTITATSVYLKANGQPVSADCVVEIIAQDPETVLGNVGLSSSNAVVVFGDTVTVTVDMTSQTSGVQLTGDLELPDGVEMTIANAPGNQFKTTQGNIGYTIKVGANGKLILDNGLILIGDSKGGGIKVAEGGVIELKNGGYIYNTGSIVVADAGGIDFGPTGAGRGTIAMGTVGGIPGGAPPPVLQVGDTLFFGAYTPTATDPGPQLVLEEGRLDVTGLEPLKVEMYEGWLHVVGGAHMLYGTGTALKPDGKKVTIGELKLNFTPGTVQNPVVGTNVSIRVDTTIGTLVAGTVNTGGWLMIQVDANADGTWEIKDANGDVIGSRGYGKLTYAGTVPAAIKIRNHDNSADYTAY